MRVVFMGTPEFAVPAFEALVAAGHEILCVYTQPPRPAGRGQKQQISAMHRAAQERGIEVRTPDSLRPPHEHAELQVIEPDIAVVAAYGLILPKPVLAAPKFGCINIHASLLPRWRGAAPIQRALLAGDDGTGISIMQMDVGLDTGDILLQERLPIGPRATAGDLHDALARLGARMIVEALEKLPRRELRPVKQPAEGVTYATKISKEELRLDWGKSAAELERKIRAFAPAPGAWFEIKGERVKLLEAELVPARGLPGTVLDEKLTVACGAQALRLLRVQRAGKAPLDADVFLRGFPLPAGTVLA
ncbi:MAG: methionyl-tRNA formyltransferase [Alphaproteobacteria bacterium]